MQERTLWTMPKFFAPDCDLSGDSIRLSGENAEHLKVLRVRNGERLTVSDGRGREALCEVAELSGDSCSLRILERGPSRGEPTVSAWVYAALPKGDKAETIVQKSVELGAAGVVFFPSERCVSRPDGKSVAGKLSRWNRVSEAAAMQSFRGRIPEVRFLPDYESMLREAAEARFSAFLWEEASELSLGGLMRQKAGFRSAALITGPEGGFSRREAEAARSAGIPAVTMGPRILRCETAPLCALAVLMFETGNLE